MKKILIALGFLILAAFACVMSPIFFRSSLSASAVPSPPPYCKPCLFYGGDFDPNGPTPNSLRNQDALTGSSAVYVGFAVPANQTWTVAGVFSNNLAQASIAEIAPPQIEWSISSDVSQGNAGTVIASGTSKATLTPTGRSWNNTNEYTVLGRLNSDQTFTLSPGHYWMTAVPVCSFFGVCEGQYYFLTDVEDDPPPHAKGFESTDVHYFYAPADSDLYVETGGPNGICSQPGGGGGGCDKFSAGLLGTAQEN
jgi:hypothetical protein